MFFGTDRRPSLSNLAVVLLLGTLILATLPAGSRSEGLALEGRNLPQYLTEEELLRLNEIGAIETATPAPAPVVRQCAQWEPSTGVLIRFDGYDFGIPAGMVMDMSYDVIIYTLCEGSEQQTAYDYMFAAGVNMDNVEFILCTTNSIWTRDYGPISIFSNGSFGGIHRKFIETVS